jgi:hypothetical protein
MFGCNSLPLCCTHSTSLPDLLPRWFNGLLPNVNVVKKSDLVQIQLVWSGAWEEVRSWFQVADRTYISCQGRHQFTPHALPISQSCGDRAQLASLAYHTPRPTRQSGQ